MLWMHSAVVHLTVREVIKVRSSFWCITGFCGPFEGKGIASQVQIWLPFGLFLLADVIFLITILPNSHNTDRYYVQLIRTFDQSQESEYYYMLMLSESKLHSHDAGLTEQLCLDLAKIISWSSSLVAVVTQLKVRVPFCHAKQHHCFQCISSLSWACYQFRQQNTKYFIGFIYDYGVDLGTRVN